MHTSFATTTRGLKRDLLPMRLYEKARHFEPLEKARGASLEETNRVVQETEDA